MATTRQAVLLIHGIGEQKPMATLRGFVRGVWTTATALHKPHPGANLHWSKPYGLSDSFELRRLTTPDNRNGIRTDFFEFYWAHLMGGTRIAHVVAWARTLLVRWPWQVPAQLQLAYWVLLGLLGIGGFFAYQAAVAETPLLSPLQSAVAGLVVVPVFTGILVNIVGDAARYLHVAPANIQTRHEIRSAGVKLLHALHEDNSYDRIIVVGHSLGSVIGLDILYHAWTAYNRDTAGKTGATCQQLAYLEEIARNVDDECYAGKIDDIQMAQHGYFDELVANGSRWRVTDFVTLGSPLAHAEVLLADGKTDLEDKFDARELPRCLPALEASQHQPPRRLFSYPPDADARLPHHAALFGPTRWTNIYFPCRLLVWGDLIGGKLDPLFGGAVRDLPVNTSRWLGFFSHTCYWKAGWWSTGHIETLRKALNLLDE